MSPGEAASVADKPVAIVTGVGPGTGSAIVRRFAAGGFRVIALARSPDRIRALEQELPDTHAVICDVSRETEVAAAIANIRKSYGSPSVLIHNAVGGGWGTFLEIEPQMLERNFRVNLRGSGSSLMRRRRDQPLPPLDEENKIALRPHQPFARGPAAEST